MCAATLQGGPEPKEVLLKFFANDADFDRELDVTSKFQSICPGLPLARSSAASTPWLASGLGGHSSYRDENSSMMASR